MENSKFILLCLSGAAFAFGAVFVMPSHFLFSNSNPNTSSLSEYAKTHSDQLRLSATLCIEPQTTMAVAKNLVANSLVSAFQNAKPKDSEYATLDVALGLSSKTFAKEITKAKSRIETLQKKLSDARLISVYAKPESNRFSSFPDSFRKDLAAAGLPTYPSISEHDANKNYANYGQLRNFRNTRSDLEEAENYVAALSSASSSIWWHFSAITNCTIENLQKRQMAQTTQPTL